MKKISMSWPPDTPDLPIRKPKEIEKLESMDTVSLNSMPGMEIDETVDDVAYAVARDYRKSGGKDIDECINIVSIALSMTGSSLGGKLGTAMVAASNSASIKASHLVFDEGQ